ERGSAGAAPAGAGSAVKGSAAPAVPAGIDLATYATTPADMALNGGRTDPAPRNPGAAGGGGGRP
ncbi:MAG: hypothetical protein ACYC1D_19840, partial [Acidimicrobiales bacterium]